MRKGDCFIDIGSNYGHYAIFAARCVGPTGFVHAVEPHPNLAKLLENYTNQKNLSPIKIYHFALGNDEGQITLRVNPNHIGASTVRFNDSDMAKNNGFIIEYTVPMHKLDNITELKGDPQKTLVKIDVEGHEPAVLRGAIDTLKNNVGCVYIEISPDWISGQKGVVDLFSDMENLGFSGFRMPEKLTKDFSLISITPNSIQTQTNVVFAKYDFINERNISVINLK